MSKDPGLLATYVDELREMAITAEMPISDVLTTMADQMEAFKLMDEEDEADYEEFLRELKPGDPWLHPWAGIAAVREKREGSA